MSDTNEPQAALNLRVEQWVLDKFKLFANQDDRSLSAAIRHALKSYIAVREKQAQPPARVETDNAE